jgi:hypothetical protein
VNPRVFRHTSFWVVKHLDVIEYIPTSILLRGVDFSDDSFPFQQPEKLSATALSWHLPRRLILASRLLAFKKGLRYWLA